MAKLPITPPTYAVNNIQQLPDIVVGDASQVKTAHDKTGSDNKSYIVNTLIPELNGSTGANMIGHSNPNIAADNVADAVEEVRQVAVQAQAGSIIDNSLGDIKLAADIKVGSLATLTTTDRDSVTDAINEVDANADSAQATATSANNAVANLATVVDIARIAKTSTGSNVAYAVDTDGVFDLTKNGNRLMFVPNVSNSGSCTITVDTNAVKNTRKANDAGTYVALEASDVKQGVPTEFVWSVSNDFFILRPSGGGNIKSIQSGVANFTNANELNITLSTIDTSKSIVIIERFCSSDDISVMWVAPKITTSTNLRLRRGQTIVLTTSVKWTVIEFNNVKRLQTGAVSNPSAETTAVTISAVSLAKSLTLVYAKCDTASGNSQFGNFYSNLSSTTNLNLVGAFGGGLIRELEWQVIEFN